jgi:hypothetical protein
MFPTDRCIALIPRRVPSPCFSALVVLLIGLIHLLLHNRKYHFHMLENTKGYHISCHALSTFARLTKQSQVLLSFPLHFLCLHSYSEVIGLPWQSRFKRTQLVLWWQTIVSSTTFLNAAMATETAKIMIPESAYTSQYSLRPSDQRPMETLLA